jgi:hypothetical protein
MKIHILVVLALLLKSSATLVIHKRFNSHKLFSSFFGELTLYDRPSDWEYTDYDWNYQ